MHEYQSSVTTDPNNTCQGSALWGYHDFCLKCSSCREPRCSSYIYEHVGQPSTSEPQNGHPRFYALLDEISALHSKKNTDYAGGDKSQPLGGFERVAAIAKLYPGMDWADPFGVAMMYMLKQLDAVLMLRSKKRDSVTGEPIGSRLKDISVYSLIMTVIEEEERNGQD